MLARPLDPQQKRLFNLCISSHVTVDTPLFTATPLPASINSPAIVSLFQLSSPIHFRSNDFLKYRQASIF